MKLYALVSIQVLLLELFQPAVPVVALLINGKSQQTFQGLGQILPVRTQKIYLFLQRSHRQLITVEELLTLQTRQTLFSLIIKQRHSRRYLQLVFQELQRGMSRREQMLPLQVQEQEVEELILGVLDLLQTLLHRQ